MRKNKIVQTMFKKKKIPAAFSNRESAVDHKHLHSSYL